MNDPQPAPPGYWLPDDIWQLINERLNETGEDTWQAKQ